MATLSPGGRITGAVLKGEIAKLKLAWAGPPAAGEHDATLATVLNERALAKLDLFDRVQLALVIQVCRESGTLSDAGRKLFAATREKRKTANDADRLCKYLTRFGLDWQAIQQG